LHCIFGFPALAPTDFNVRLKSRTARFLRAFLRGGSEKKTQTAVLRRRFC
jgi:hypothetical protein